MQDLRMLWEIGGLIEDGNDDHVADRVNVSIMLENGVFPEGLIDFCARLGFETTSLSFDFLQENEDYLNKLIFVQNDFENHVQWLNNQLMVAYQNQEKLSDLLRFLAGKWHADFGNDNTPVIKISLVDEAVTLTDECGRVFEAGLETADMDEHSVKRKYNIKSLTDVWSQFGFLHQKDASPNNEQAITFKPNKKLDDKAWAEVYYGASRIGMESTVLAFPMTGAYSKNPLTLTFQPNNSNKASIQLQEHSIQFSGNNKSLYHAISYFFREQHWSFGGHFGSWENPQKSPPPEEVLFSCMWEDQGEVTMLYHHLEKFKKNNIASEPMDITVFISEPLKIRKEIHEQIQNSFTQARVIIRSAYKPGYFWLMEEIVPALKKLKDQIGDMKIKCFKEEREDGLELPIRWIQELYPVDEMISNDLGIDSQNINFELCENLDATYEISVYDVQKKLIYHNHLEIPVSKVPYVAGGKYSYPTTGFLSVYQDDQPLMNSMIKTDRERFYMYYHEQILPKLWKMADFTDDNSGFLKPLFDRIEIEAEMSEEELKLPVAEERISSLEALHEDLYFNTLDFFSEKGEAIVGKRYSAPGGIYPFLKVSPGLKPKVKCKAYKWIDQQTEKLFTKELFFTSEQKQPVEVNFVQGNKVVNKTVSKQPKMDQIPSDVFQPQLARVRPCLVDYSYRGKPIFIYEFFNDIQEAYYSAIKLSIFKPTILIETGHHANEVSSMPAVVEMLDEITQQHPKLIKNMNMVVIPQANPDGAALQQRMIKDNPEWKHHAARYNAVGLEYGVVRYQDTIFGEANVVPNIMNRWAPDVVIDNHGIPSHEWTQPFAGYHIPPKFNMSYWIPNAMVYGIAQKLDDKRFPQHKAVLDQITTSIQQKVKSSVIHKLNHYWMERYKKYGHQFMPNLFPIELTGDLIFYKWPMEPNSNGHQAISRFPDWISADLMSEAADETVYDEALEICKHAQKLFDIAAIEWIEKDAQVVQRTYNKDSIIIKRQRPLNI